VPCNLRSLMALKLQQPAQTGDFWSGSPAGSTDHSLPGQWLHLAGYCQCKHHPSPPRPGRNRIESALDCLAVGIPERVSCLRSRSYFLEHSGGCLFGHYPGFLDGSKRQSVVYIHLVFFIWELFSIVIVLTGILILWYANRPPGV